MQAITKTHLLCDAELVISIAVYFSSSSLGLSPISSNLVY
jgi:hypothetical protein